MEQQRAHTKEFINPELEQQLLSGDEAAMKRFFNHYYSRLQFFAFKLIDDAQDAEDIVSEAFLNFWLNIRSAKVATGNLQAYLYKMVRNRCLNYLERKQMISERNGEVIEQFYTKVQKQMDETTVKAELFYQVKQHFTRLTPIQLTVMEMLYTKDMSIEEVAEALHTTPNNIRNHKARALERLRGIIGASIIIFIFLLFFLEFIVMK